MFVILKEKTVIKTYQRLSSCERYLRDLGVLNYQICAKGQLPSFVFKYAICEV